MPDIFQANLKDISNIFPIYLGYVTGILMAYPWHILSISLLITMGTRWTLWNLAYSERESVVDSVNDSENDIRYDVSQLDI